MVSSKAKLSKESIQTKQGVITLRKLIQRKLLEVAWQEAIAFPWRR